MRKIYLLAWFVLFGGAISAQTSLSFYHLGDATWQGSSYNPAWMPGSKVFIGLPVLSGVHVHANNKFSYNQAIRQEGNNNVVRVSSLLSDLQRQNMTSVHAGISLLHLGYRLPNGNTVVSLFANERMEADVLYSRELVEFVWRGNGGRLGEVIDLGQSGTNVSHFREIGMGVAHRVNDQLRVGARLKMYQGFMNISTPRNMTATLEVNPQTYAMKLEAENTMIRTSGLDIYGGSEGSMGKHLMSPGNSGFGLDIGFDYEVNKYLSFSASLVDVGFISWKTDISNTAFSDTTFTYSGVNIKGVDDLPQVLQDSLLDKFSTSKNSDAYSTWMPTKAYGSMTWKYTENTHFIGSVGARYIHGQLKMLYGGGIRQYMGPMVATVNVMKLPQHFFNLGAALAVKGGPVQYFVAADQIVNFSVPDAKAFDFRMGINIMLGKPAGRGPGGSQLGSTFDNSRLRQDDPKGVSTGSFLGERVKTKRREGIYSVIGKQKKRDVPASVKPPRGSKKKAKARTSKRSKQKYPSKRRRN